MRHVLIVALVVALLSVLPVPAESNAAANLEPGRPFDIVERERAISGGNEILVDFRFEVLRVADGSPVADVTRAEALITENGDKVDVLRFEPPPTVKELATVL